MDERYKYQVALSFAGEQRDYVEKVAQHLVARESQYSTTTLKGCGSGDRT